MCRAVDVLHMMRVLGRVTVRRFRDGRHLELLVLVQVIHR